VTALAEGTAASVAPAANSTPATAGSDIRYSHSGHRYVLGYGADFFGIWDRQAPAAPVERYARDDDGWRQAWIRFVSLEPGHVEVAQAATGPVGAEPHATGAANQPTTATETAAAPGAAPTTSTTDPPGKDIDESELALQYTHSGQRYLLGYGTTFFGIWDRHSPAVPIEKFARDDVGWTAAWRRYTSLEPNYAEVGLGGGQNHRSSGSASS
jgi:hypothetical protein